MGEGTTGLLDHRSVREDKISIYSFSFFSISTIKMLKFRGTCSLYSLSPAQQPEVCSVFPNLFHLVKLMRQYGLKVVLEF